MSYRLVGATCGAVSFQPLVGVINKESQTRSSKMTSNAIEGGSTLTDHVSLNPEQYQIGGVFVSNAAYYKDALNKMWKTRDLVSYYGVDSFQDAIITNLSFSISSQNKDGFSFTATLQKANFATGQYVEMGQVTLMSQQDEKSKVTGGSGSSGSAATKSAGMKTKVSQNISDSAYSNYVNSYNGGSSSGPAQRGSAGHDGAGR